MMDTVDYRSTPAHQMLSEHLVSPYHGHHHHHHQQQQQQPGGGGSRMLQSPSSPSDSYTATASSIDTSYATLQPLPSSDKYTLQATSTAGLLGSSGASGGFAGFMDEMTINPYAAATYKYDKLNGMQENCSAAAAAFCAGPSGYGMIQNGYGGHHGHHQSSLASLYHHPGTASGYVSPNGFQLSAHHKSLLDTKPPTQMMSPGSSPAVASYDPYSRGSGLLSVATGPPAPPTGAAAAAALLLPPSAPSPLSAAYGSHHMFSHHHHHHHGSPTTSPSSRALHHSLSAAAGPHRSLHELRAGTGTTVATLRGGAAHQTAANGTTPGGSHCHDIEEINTRELAQKISSELKRYSIPQAVFAQRVLCRSQGTLSDLLRNPKPWSKLKSGRETFRRMWKWLQEPEYQRMSALRLAGWLPHNVHQLLRTDLRFCF